MVIIVNGGLYAKLRRVQLSRVLGREYQPVIV